jgi:hypothetical protein
MFVPTGERSLEGIGSTPQQSRSAFPCLRGADRSRARRLGRKLTVVSLASVPTVSAIHFAACRPRTFRIGLALTRPHSSQSSSPPLSSCYYRPAGNVTHTRLY